MAEDEVVDIDGLARDVDEDEVLEHHDEQERQDREEEVMDEGQDDPDDQLQLHDDGLNGKNNLDQSLNVMFNIFKMFVLL